MTEQRHHLTTEDFAERPRADREPTEQTPADRDVAEPDLTDQERLDREPVQHGNGFAHGQTDAGGQVGTHGRVGALGQTEAHGRTDALGQPVVHDESGRHDEPVGHDEHGTHDEPVAHDEHDEHGRHDEPVVSEPSAATEVSATPGDSPLFTGDDAADYQAEWRALQTDFVDDPREAVQRADELVAQVIQSLATTFTRHKHSLEEQWQRGDEVETEELRQALKRYRSFFDRLLSV
jgi:hypothetical protein